MSDSTPTDTEAMWRSWFMMSATAPDMKRTRRILGKLPADPRCKLCNVPFQGIGGSLSRIVLHKEPSAMNPLFCNACEQAARRFPGGAEVDMSILFADIRGSTALAEKMSPRDYSQLLSRFYTVSTKEIINEDGLVEKLAGDEVVAFWGPGLAGPHYVRRTLEAAQKVMRALTHAGIPAGIGVHCGEAYFGVISTTEGMGDISINGDTVNTTARLCAKAAAGEILVSEQALQAAAYDGSGLESRTLELKGISEPVAVRVLRAQ